MHRARHSDANPITDETSSDGHDWGSLVSVGIAFLIFELTASPALSVLVGSLKFGWKDFKQAFWVKRLHPERIRGMVLARWLIAAGFWKSSGAAWALVLSLGIYHELRGPAGLIELGPHGKSILESLGLLLCFGFLATGFMSIIAVFSGLRHSVRVWLGGSRNTAEQLLWYAFFPFMVIIFWIMLLLLLEVSSLNQNLTLNFRAGIYVVGGIITPGLLFLCFKDWIIPRTLADSPEECWDVAWLVKPTQSRKLKFDDPNLETIDSFDQEP